MRIAVFGLGYVGIVSAACLAERGHEVIGVDPSHDKVAMVAQGRSTIVEERIGELVSEAVAAGRLRATADAAEAVAASDLALICVGTPSSGNGSLSTMYLERVADEIGAAIATLGRRYTVVFRSTMLPGTCEGILIPRLEAASGLRAGDDFGVAVNPEFLREGTSVRDFNDPPKTVVGGRPAHGRHGGVALRRPSGRRPPRADRGRRDDEVRRQLLPRAQDRLRQRDGRDLPGLRRRLARGDGGLRLRHQAQHLARLPAAGLRVRRLVPAQGPARDRLPRAPRRPLGADPRERDRLQRGAPAPRLRPADRGQRAPRRTARPGLQAGHRRPAREPAGRARRAPARPRLRPQHPRRARAHLAPHGLQPRLRGRAHPAPLAAHGRHADGRRLRRRGRRAGEHRARLRRGRRRRPGRAARRPRAAARADRARRAAISARPGRGGAWRAS